MAVRAGCDEETESEDALCLLKDNDSFGGL